MMMLQNRRGLVRLDRLEVVLAFAWLVEGACLAMVVAIVGVLGERLILRHLVNLISHRIRRISCLVYLLIVLFKTDLRLVAVLEPVVEVIAKLLQQVHIPRVVVISPNLSAHVGLLGTIRVLISLIHPIWIVTIHLNLIGDAKDIVEA